jgi:hypothetical protein
MVIYFLFFVLLKNNGLHGYKHATHIHVYDVILHSISFHSLRGTIKFASMPCTNTIHCVSKRQMGLPLHKMEIT